MTRKILPFLLVAVIATGAAFAHGGKSHRLLGTVKELHGDHLVVKASDGHEVTVKLAKTTKYEQDKKAATRSALAAGVRVSIQTTEDDKTAVKVKIEHGKTTQATDPVCGMKVDSKTALKSVHAGKTHYFCSKEDKEKFDKNPEAYLNKKSS